MSFASWFFLISYILIAGFTFYFWLQPEPKTQFRAGAASILAVMFFLSSFALGVWISVLRMKGQLWMF